LKYYKAKLQPLFGFFLPQCDLKGYYDNMLITVRW
jgi:hypothetical protein